MPAPCGSLPLSRSPYERGHDSLARHLPTPRGTNERERLQRGITAFRLNAAILGSDLRRLARCEVVSCRRLQSGSGRASHRGRASFSPHGSSSAPLAAKRYDSRPPNLDLPLTPGQDPSMSPLRPRKIVDAVVSLPLLHSCRGGDLRGTTHHRAKKGGRLGLALHSMSDLWGPCPACLCSSRHVDLPLDSPLLGFRTIGRCAMLIEWYLLGLDPVRPPRPAVKTKESPSSSSAPPLLRRPISYFSVSQASCSRGHTSPRLR